MDPNEILATMVLQLENGEGYWKRINPSQIGLWNYQSIDRAFTSTLKWGTTSYEAILLGEVEVVYPLSKETNRSYTLVLLESGIPVESMEEEVFEGSALSDFAGRVSSLNDNKE